MNRPVLIIDGLNLFVRHFVVNPTISVSGDHVGGIVGFLRALKHLAARTLPSRIIVAWEGGGAPRKRAIYSDYKRGSRPKKLNRYYGEEIPDTVENRNNQVSSIISILKSVPIDQVYINDCEADDIISYIVRNNPGPRYVIASSDKDLYQLLSKKVIQWSPGQKKFLTMKDIHEKFNISAVNFCTVRSFVGDSSDNLPGVPLAGFSSMSKRFPELSGSDFISVKDIVDSAEEKMETSKLKIIKNICEYSDRAKMNWRLMYLDVKNLSANQIEKIEYILENPHRNRNKLSLIKAFSNLGINNFDLDSFYSTLASIRKST